MAYTLQELGSAQLISMYREYLVLTDKLADGEIDQLEALELVDSLGVKDAYGSTWKVDPNSGTFLVISPKGAQEVNVDPITFHPSADDDTDVTKTIPAYQYEERTSAAGAVVTPKGKSSLVRKIGWGIGGVVGVAAIFHGGFALGTNGESDQLAVEQERIERPVVEDPGPTPERIRQVLDQLGSGESSRVDYAIPNPSDAGRLNWAFATLGSLAQNGYNLVETRTEEGVSVLEVRDRNGEVVMAGDLEWTQDSGGGWVLAEAPLLAPPGDELPDNSELPEPSEGADTEEEQEPAEVEEAPADEGAPAEAEAPAEDAPKDDKPDPAP